VSAESLVLDKVRAALGLDDCKFLWSGAAPIQRATLEYFASLGLPINETYGMSENTGSITCGTAEMHVWGSVGAVVPGCEIRVLRNDAEEGQPAKWVEAKKAADLFRPSEEEQGELCFRGRNIMLGYMSSEAVGDAADIVKKNKETIDENGFLHSGDKGCVDERGMFRITGRYKELIIGASLALPACLPAVAHARTQPCKQAAEGRTLPRCPSRTSCSSRRPASARPS
jgi:long-subunit acyl-CoA synthetase (AMP-forming)